MLKALGSPVRMQLVTYMAEHPTCMTRQIVASTPLAQSTVSQHLKVLRDAGLIQGEIEGPATCYCLDPGGFHWLEQHLQAWIQRRASDTVRRASGSSPPGLNTLTENASARTGRS